MPPLTLVVATDGSESHDLRVRDAAASARERRLPLHVVCSVPARSSAGRRRLFRDMPADMAHMATDAGQRDAAVGEVRSLLAPWLAVIELSVSATSLRPAAAERALAARLGGEVHGSPARPRLASRWALRPRLRPAV